MLQRWRDWPWSGRAASVVVGVLLVAAALVPWGLRWFVNEQVSFNLEVRGVGSRWALQWTPEDAGRPVNGYWLEVRDFTSNATGPITFDKPRKITRRLPVYAWRDLRVEWHDSPGGAFRVTGLTYTTRLFDITRPPRQADLAAEGHSGATRGADGWVTLDAPSGRALLAHPTRPTADVAMVYAGMVVLVAGALAAAWVVWRVVLAWDALAARLPTRLDPLPKRHPILAATAIAATFLVPLWMRSWAPMLIEGDGVAYIALAMRFIEDPSIRHYDGWRLPGYAALIAPLVALGGDYTAPIGVLHVVLAWLAPCFARAALARRVSARWAWIGMLATACNPMLIVWQRHVLAECLTTCLVMALFWALVRFEDRCRAGRVRTGRLIAAGVGFGLFLGLATLVRGNFQMALVLVPMALGWAAWNAAGPKRAVAVALACVLTGSAVLLPVYVHVRRTFGVWAYTVGPGWHRAIRTWDNAVADWNQTAVFSYEEARELRRRMAARPVNEFEFTHYLGECETYPVPAGTRFERARDIRGMVFARETRDRLPDKHAEIVPKAIVSLMGFHVRRPGYFRGYSFALVRDFIGRPTAKPTTLRGPYTYLPAELRDGVKRGENPIDTRGSWNAAVLGKAWDAARVVRPWLSVLFVIAAWRLFLRREAALTGVAVVIAAHAVALPVLYYAGTDRYIMPWWGLADMVVICGLGRLGARASLTGA